MKRNHWHLRERPDLHQWVAKEADEAFGERTRIRLDYLRWLHRAVLWERTKEKLPAVLMFAAWWIIPGSTIAILAYKAIKRRKTHAK